MANTNDALRGCRGRRKAARTAVLLWLALTAALPLAQQPDPAQPRIVGTPAAAVLVDIVVRDRQGVLVTDLDADGVEVFEDGVRQRIEMFEPPRAWLTPGTSGGLGHPSSRLVSSTLTGAPRLVALVFHELGPEARAAAHKAARIYLEEQKASDEFVGVFVIDRALHTVVPFTRDVGRLERGVRTAIMRPGCPEFFEGDVAPAESGGGACTDDLSRRQRATETLRALTAVIEGVQPVPGRKSVLLFSEAIPLESESDAMDRFNAVIGRANRSGVSFYTVDAAGLRARSPSAGARKALREFTAETPGVTVSPDAVMYAEPYVALSRLAIETGGAFLDNTNELERAARRMGEDLRSYYLLGYVPTNAALDGKYRRIDVRVRRPGVTVQARAGYLALPLRRTLSPHDIAPLLILEQGTRPRDFRFEADADTSRTPAQIRARVEHRMLRYERNADSTICQARLTVLARAVDRDDRTLWVSSDAFDLSSPSARCDAAQHGATTFERAVTLPRDTARLDVIAYDALAERASVRDFEVRLAKR
jgi:VWFA-related protein